MLTGAACVPRTNPMTRPADNILLRLWVDVEVRLTNGAEIYPHRKDLSELPFWKCDTCGNFVGCHHKTGDPTKPLGVIPTSEIKRARQHIHRILDPILERWSHEARRLVCGGFRANRYQELPHRRSARPPNRSKGVRGNSRDPQKPQHEMASMTRPLKRRDPIQDGAVLVNATDAIRSARWPFGRKTFYEQIKPHLSPVCSWEGARPLYRVADIDAFFSASNEAQSGGPKRGPKSRKSAKWLICKEWVVRVEGLEPPRLAAPEPKSGASTNFATPAVGCAYHA